MTPKNNIIIGIIVALLVIASYNVDANPIDFVEGLPNLLIILEEIVAVGIYFGSTATISSRMIRRLGSPSTKSIGFASTL
jgi:hypothetical protein